MMHANNLGKQSVHEYDLGILKSMLVNRWVFMHEYKPYRN